MAENEVGRPLLYESVAAKIAGMIERGAFRPGDRIPSIRELSSQLHVSVNTVLGAYAQLENMRLVEARPQSGYYVRSRLLEPESPPPRPVEEAELAAQPVAMGEEHARVIRNISNPTLVPLGQSGPDPALLPTGKLSRMLASESRRRDMESICHSPLAGVERLRSAISRRSLAMGCSLAPEEIVITSGCMEAVALALQAVCRPGDTVAISSPVFYTFLNSIQWLGLKVVEIPTCPRTGMKLDVLRYALGQHPVQACISIPNYGNPTGSLMPAENKRGLVELLAKHGIPLIEDDVYGDLAFAGPRPETAKAFDRRGLVLLCSSFSKSLAPGYRVGWMAPGRFQKQIEHLKSLFHTTTSTPSQLAIAEFLTNGGYDRHVRALCRAYARQVAQFRELIGRHFPAGTRVTNPPGGSVLWVEMSEGVDAFTIYEEALREGIAIAPGMLFTTGRDFRNCMRLNAAFWSGRVEKALMTLGRLARYSAARRRPGVARGV
ncbi:MAG: PLP-dependent aminotransferase family protein [Acidobacteria bacterium]|nr:PLP-dependent aminotransferase family protein [Acidobacteriota bacterium]